jgi:salicylate hydroxylase
VSGLLGQGRPRPGARQAPELREVGAAIALTANATRVLQHLGLGDGLAQLWTEPTELIHRDGRDGHQIAAPPR